MSYPPPLYDGPGGEPTATFRPADSPPDLTYPTGNTVHYLATAESTDGQFGLYRWEMGRDPSGPGPHFHRSISESFFILSGTVRIFNGTDWIKARPGDYVHVPAGGIHGFRNEDGPASMLLHFAPGAPREDYFKRLPRVPGMTAAERDSFFAEHDNTWL